MFFAQARVYVKGGDGGDGEVAYRREAHVALGGAFGGSGGPGGNVFLIADEGDNTLASVRAKLSPKPVHQRVLKHVERLRLELAQEGEQQEARYGRPTRPGRRVGKS